MLDDGLQLRFVVPSILGLGTARPISIAVHDRVLYVLNEGVGAVPDHVQGFVIADDGFIAPSGLSGSTSPLSAPQTDPAQIEFSPDGSFLVVTEKATNIIDVFALDDDGLIVSHQTQPSEGQTPFGFAFGRRNQLFVSKPRRVRPALVACLPTSCYRTVVSTQSRAPPTTGTATCWVVTSNDGRFAYVTNTGSANLSAFNIAFDGDITLRNAGTPWTG